MMQISSEIDHGLSTWMNNTAALGWPSCCHIPYVRTKGQTFVSASAAMEFLGIPGCIQHLEHHLECTDLNQAFREKGSKKQDLISLEAFILLVFGGIPSCRILQKNSSKLENIKKLRHYFLEKIAPGLYNLECSLIYDYRVLFLAFWPSGNTICSYSLNHVVPIYFRFG